MDKKYIYECLLNIIDKEDIEVIGVKRASCSRVKVLVRICDRLRVLVKYCVMNVYLFPIYFLFSLVYFYIHTIAYAIILMPYTLIQSYMFLSFSISLIKPYLFITFSLPFHSLSQGLIRCIPFYYF